MVASAKGCTHWPKECKRTMRREIPLSILRRASVSKRAVFQNPIQQIMLGLGIQPLGLGYTYTKIRVRVKERIITVPGQAIGQGSGPRARVVTCSGGGNSDPPKKVLFVRIVFFSRRVSPKVRFLHINITPKKRYFF